MVLISLDPFAFRKTLLVAIALLFLSAFCFADPVFMARERTTAPRVQRVHPSGGSTNQLTSAPTAQPIPPAASAPLELPLFPLFEAPFLALQISFPAQSPGWAEKAPQEP